MQRRRAVARLGRVWGWGFTDGCGRCDQLIDDDALAPLELPGGPAGAQLPGGLGAKLLSVSSKFFSISGDGAV